MSEPLISLKNVCKIFETEELETHALRRVDLEIRRGDFVSISGSSGCGKSTLLSILGLLDFASDGEYLLKGEDVTSLSLDRAAEIRNKYIGFIFQSFNLIDELSVFDNVALPLHYSNEELNSDEINEKVNKCLATVKMGHRSGHKPNQLSGGQQQRVAIARALVNEPVILLVDEPTGNLDSVSGDAIIEVLSDLNDRGVTILIVTHDPRYAEVASRKLILRDGSLVDR